MMLDSSDSVPPVVVRKNVNLLTEGDTRPSEKVPCVTAHDKK